MTIKFTKRVAADILDRGVSAVRINSNSIGDAEKAMTREDVKRLIKNGGVFALKAKKNVSLNSKRLKERREKGRGRGPGKRKGTSRARQGDKWMKKVRSQRKLLKALRSEGVIDRATFKRFYVLIKGNSFADKKTILLHLNEQGVKISNEQLTSINNKIKQEWS
jgi:large subunit ribosomal protein L19e